MLRKIRLSIISLLGFCYFAEGTAHSETSWKVSQGLPVKQEMTLQGEVHKPGKYLIQSGITLSKILLEAGGFTPLAYPLGAIFTRDFKGDGKGRKRMMVETDYVILQVHPEKDIVLEPGDQLFVPKRPSHILVEGKVQRPQAILFESGMSAKDYIQRAGGVLKGANLEKTMAYYPNGKVKQLTLSPWNYKEIKLPPGTRICVE